GKISISDLPQRDPEHPCFLLSGKRFGRLKPLSRLAEVVLLVRFYLQASTQFIERSLGYRHRRVGGGRRTQPGLFPEDTTAIPAAIVTAAVATWAVQHHDIVGRKTSEREVRRANLHDPAFDVKTLPAPTKHFRHEREAIEAAVAIEGR